MDAKKVTDTRNTYKRKGKDKAREKDPKKALEEEALEKTAEKGPEKAPEEEALEKTPEKGPEKATDKVTEEKLAEGRVHPTASNRIKRQRERGEEQPKGHVRTKRKARKVVHDDEDEAGEPAGFGVDEEKAGETMTGVDEVGEPAGLGVDEAGEPAGLGVDEAREPAGMGVRDFAAEMTEILLSVGGEVSDEHTDSGDEHTDSGELENRKKNAADVQPYSSSSSEDEPDADYHVSPIPRGELHSQEEEGEGVEGEGVDGEGEGVEGEGVDGEGEDFDDLRPFSSDEDDAPDAVGEEQVEKEVAPEGEGEVADVVPGDSHPGGPQDGSILNSYGSHIAADIWENNEREPLKCVSHGMKIRKWKVDLNDAKKKDYVKLINDSGLASLVDGSYKIVDKVLCSAFVERWMPETNTFHMPFGEMTITLDDVSTILGVSVSGRSVVLTEEQKNMADEKLVSKALGISEVEALVHLKEKRGSSVRMDWLLSRFEKGSDSKTQKEREYAARAYLLYLLGCTLFSDKSGTRVPCSYLHFLMDLSEVHKYAWGAAALAWLYRQLGYSTRSASRQLGGYLTLLEAWIYDHIKRGRPPMVRTYKPDRPLVHRWSVLKDRFGSTIEHLKELREKLDGLDASEVLFLFRRR